MKEFGEDWDNKPVCRSISTVSGIALNGWFTERYAHVAHEQDPRNGESGDASRRPGNAIAPSQFFSYTHDVNGK